jgi:ribulose-phosphate 3-epimerase
MSNSEKKARIKEPMIAPSIFAADFYNISRAITLCETSHVDCIHYDVMDNHFTNNISFGPKIIQDIVSRTCLPADVHLMITFEDTGKLSPYLALPVQNITMHLESMESNAGIFIETVHNSGKTAGLSISPRTDIDRLLPYLDTIDRVLVMSVEPGYSGQVFIPETLARLQKLRQEGRDELLIEVDGGITRKNYELILQSGADILVIGNHFFEDGNTLEWVKAIKRFSVLQ